MPAIALGVAVVVGEAEACAEGETAGEDDATGEEWLATLLDPPHAAGKAASATSQAANLGAAT
ncbi:MAG TPA: hypothetical protein VFL27_15205 [Candidatus Dormibacteraeota bacterium]|nr:hypothetical protein [Candidatus Dormibacteraeota bacterium]